MAERYGPNQNYDTRQSTIGPLRARPLPPRVIEAPNEQSIFSGHLQPTEIGRLTSRPAFTVNGEIAQNGGWPAPIIRQSQVRFGVVPHYPVHVAVNVVTGIPSTPQPRQGRRRSR